LSELSSDFKWYERVNVGALGDDVRRSILKAVKDKLGFTKTCEVPGIAKSSLHRYLAGERRVPDDVVRKALQHLTREEFESIASDWDKLRALGVVGDDGVATTV
jgi:hypothetical protein